MEGAADRAAMRDLLGRAMWAELEVPADRPGSAHGAGLGARPDAIATLPAIELAALTQVESDGWPDEVREFVPLRIDVDLERLRAELIGVAVLWLGVDEVRPIVSALSATRPGVDEFVTTIASIQRTRIPGHEASFVRAMAREMHYRAAQTLCGA